MSVSLVLPCYNEEEGVQRVIASLPDGIDEIIVVDNNCTDRTAEVAAALGAIVVPERTPGYGAACKAGLRAATCDVLVLMDGDGTYPTESIVPLVTSLTADRLDFISGCRFPLENSAAMHSMNRLGNMALTAAAAILFLTPLRDSQSGMWVFRRHVLDQIRLESDGMPLSEEIKIEAIRRWSIRFEERHIPYHPRTGEVKLVMWRDGLRNLVHLARLRFRPMPRRRTWVLVGRGLRALVTGGGRGRRQLCAPQRSR
jgi:glycosyltransferase involved in cell wall biosynthesis